MALGRVSRPRGDGTLELVAAPGAASHAPAMGTVAEAG
jgi:hypothetical protein